MFQDCRLGLKEPDQKRIDRHVKLTPADVNEAMISRVPFDWQLGQRWNNDDLGNRSLNNCGPCGVVNWCNLMGKVAGLNVPTYGREEAERIYRRMGYDGTFATDDGVILLDLMYRWMLEEFCGTKILGFFVIGHVEDDHLATANTIAPTIAAASLTTACKSTDMWNDKAADGRLWGNHAFLYFSDSPGGGLCKTWGRKAFHTAGFRKRRWIECYLPISPIHMPHVDIEKAIKIARQL